MTFTYLCVSNTWPSNHQHAHMEAPHQEIPVPFPLHTTDERTAVNSQQHKSSPPYIRGSCVRKAWRRRAVQGNLVVSTGARQTGGHGLLEYRAELLQQSKGLADWGEKCFSGTSLALQKRSLKPKCDWSICFSTRSNSNGGGNSPSRETRLIHRGQNI